MHGVSKAKIGGSLAVCDLILAASVWVMDSDNKASGSHIEWCEGAVDRSDNPPLKVILETRAKTVKRREHDG